MALTLEHFKHRKRPAPDWIIPGWLKRGNVGFILGAPKKACKSWLLLNMAWQLSEGKPVWGIHTVAKRFLFSPTKPMRVVYFTQEDTEDDIHDRIQMFFDRGETPNDRLHIIPKNLQNVLDTPNGMSNIIKELESVKALHGPIDLILFDPMRRMHGKDENSSEHINALWAKIDDLHRRFNCSTVFSHHVKKPSDNPNSTSDPTSPYAGRGSGDLFGGGDAFINVITRVVHNQPIHLRNLDLHFETKRGKPLPPAAVRFNFRNAAIEFDRLKTEDFLDNDAEYAQTLGGSTVQ